jgi:cytochrome bd-type quinol oxidase subunit 2
LLALDNHYQEEEGMQLSKESVMKNKKWHVPVSIATLAMGIYLTLVCMIPSFAPEYHNAITSERIIFMIIPYAIFIMIGAPLYTLWVYTKMDTDEEFCEQYFE